MNLDNAFWKGFIKAAEIHTSLPGGLIGGLAGGGIGYLAGRDKDPKKNHSLRDALIGAGLGGGVGAVAPDLALQTAGRVATDIKAPIGYDIKDTLDHVKQNKMQTVKDVIHDKVPEAYGYGNARSPEEMYVRDYLTRGGFHLGPHKEYVDKFGKIFNTVGPQTVEYNTSNPVAAEHDKASKEFLHEQLGQYLNTKKTHEWPKQLNMDDPLLGGLRYQLVQGDDKQMYYDALKPWQYSSAYLDNPALPMRGYSDDPHSGRNMSHETTPTEKLWAMRVNKMIDPEKIHLRYPVSDFASTQTWDQPLE